MHTRLQLQRCLTAGLTHRAPDTLSVRKHAGGWCGTSRTRIVSGETAPALMLLVSAFLVLVTGCSQQSSQEAVNQINGRLEQLEQKVAKLEEQNTRINEWMSNTQSSFISVDEKLAALGRQIEQVASRSSASAAGKSVQPPAAASPGKKQYHTVSSGETLYSIARKYGISVDDVRRLNNLSQNQPIQAGQKLVIVPAR